MRSPHRRLSAPDCPSVIARTSRAMTAVNGEATTPRRPQCRFTPLSSRSHRQPCALPLSHGPLILSPQGFRSVAVRATPSGQRHAPPVAAMFLPSRRVP